MNKLPLPSIWHDAWRPELETSHMILALLQEMSNSSAAVQGNHLSAAGTSLHHHGCSVAQWLGRWIRDQEVASSTPGGCVSE